ncbi:hypothetical protein [Paenibacillus sp. LHD-38]|uniref:hypothetical protein n=1 Tax=Paenibacillus sp. LHD-38 TaxID=3072143 RepID=UPI00280EE677|nr:hypothetical protein [Paenibacillus sp. LHD-38]MDQ8737045.1 hypothetical protein [Paenibacillus sp. LHD-38]
MMEFIDLLTNPDNVEIELDGGWIRGVYRSREWCAGEIVVTCKVEAGRMSVQLNAGQTPVRRLHLRWKRELGGPVQVLGDHWERGYGDMEWRGLVAEREMPWYFLLSGGGRTDGYGVETGTSSFCYWQADAGGISLTLDVRCGEAGVLLGARTLEAAVIVTRRGLENETAFQAATAFCQTMCNKPLLPQQPVYGGNNWYYAYGKSSTADMLADSERVSSWASSTENRPFMVIDDGWQLCSGGGSCNGGPWEPNYLFSDMQQLASDMKELGVRPGIWCRPLLVANSIPYHWRRYGSQQGGIFLDPSEPDVLDYVGNEIRKLHDWGYELIKHDFSTFDIFGKWGFEMGASLSSHGLAFSDQTKTTAEIIVALYEKITEASGDSLIIGCNTVGHLAAGVVEIQRTGDDTSGKEWERTRKMGVNTLAFRMPQHNTFFAADADCVGLTQDVPWSLNKQWLELLSESGTPLFVSADPSAIGAEQEAAIRRAFEHAAKPLPSAEPLDWLEDRCPSRWKLAGEERRFDWYGDRGVQLNMRPELILR